MAEIQPANNSLQRQVEQLQLQPSQQSRRNTELSQAPLTKQPRAEVWEGQLQQNHSVKGKKGRTITNESWCIFKDRQNWENGEMEGGHHLMRSYRGAAI